MTPDRVGHFRRPPSVVLAVVPRFRMSRAVPLECTRRTGCSLAQAAGSWPRRCRPYAEQTCRPGRRTGRRRCRGHRAGRRVIDPGRLLADLTRLRADLEADLHERCEENTELDSFLRGEHREAVAQERTASSYAAWREDRLTQVAVAWILGCVFVRFLEDNALVDPPRLSGPGERRQRALDEHTLYFREHPTDSDREYLFHVFRAVAALPIAGQIFDERHNPIWSLPEGSRAPSGDVVGRLLRSWQRIDPDSGSLAHDFTDPGWDTRFLGDLYQDLSESARKQYALLQTPEFVEEFILDRTLTPAIEEFGFREVRLIDPACGSGHFLLGAFQRLDALWAKHEPGTNPRDRASRVLKQVAGVDLNAFAAAIARFRLCIAALLASGVKRLTDAPGFEFKVATGDSLLHGPRLGLAGARQEYLDPEHDPLGHVYRTEDSEMLRSILGRRYHVVLGNPPYITPKDKAQNHGYRERFGSLLSHIFQHHSSICGFGAPGGEGGMNNSTSERRSNRLSWRTRSIRCRVQLSRRTNFR